MAAIATSMNDTLLITRLIVCCYCNYWQFRSVFTNNPENPT